MYSEVLLCRTHTALILEMSEEHETRKFLYDDLLRWIRSPGEYVSESNDSIDSSGTVIIRNHARTVAVKLQHLLYYVEYFLNMRALGSTLVFLYVPQ